MAQVNFDEVIPCARGHVLEALQIACCAAEAESKSEIWGAHQLIEGLEARFEKYEDNKAHEFGPAAADIEAALSVLLLVADLHGNILLEGAYTILKFAEQMLEEAIRASKGGANA